MRHYMLKTYTKRKLALLNFAKRLKGSNLDKIAYIYEKQLYWSTCNPDIDFKFFKIVLLSISFHELLCRAQREHFFRMKTS